MKIVSKNINNFQDKILDGSISGVLLYGPNQGLINNINNNIIKNLKLEIKNTDFNLINNSSLYNYTNTIDLFSNRLIIKINNVTAALNPNARQILNSQIINFVIFIAEDLSPNSTLREFFENSKDYLSIACYYQEAWEIKTLILEFLKRYNKSISQDALTCLVDNLAGDYQFIISELEKLILYIDQNTIIELKDIESCLMSNIESSIEDVCYYFADNDSKNFFSSLNRLVNDNIQIITILRAIGRLFNNLYLVNKSINSKISLDAALKNIKPPIFFKYLPKFKKLIERNNINYCHQMLILLIEYESIYKTTGCYQKNLIEQLYIQKISLN